MSRKYECSLCRKRFKTEAGCQQHQKDFHSKRTDGTVVDVVQARVELKATRHIEDDYMSEADYYIQQRWGI